VDAAGAEAAAEGVERQLAVAGLGLRSRARWAVVHPTTYLSSQTLAKSWLRKWLGLIFQPFT
jgi:hypothetical protein